MSKSPLGEDGVQRQQSQARTSFIVGWLGFLGGVGGVPEIVLTAVGAVALVFGILALRKGALKLPTRWMIWSMSGGGIVLGGFCLLVGLGGLLMPNRVIERARTLITLNEASSLATAINGFLTEYGDLPDVAKRVETDTPEGLKLLNIIMGMETGANPQNSRGIKFLNAREGKGKRGGLIYDSSGTWVEGLYDSWGNPYVVVLDTAFDERLQFKWTDQSVENLTGRRAVVFSAGPDQALGTSDDITTW